jgi:hypothetical protein
MNMQECPSYEKCEAPICPLDDSSKDIALWYPDEEICGSMQFRKEKWRIAQRKIAKRAIDRDTYFTKPMLEVATKVTPHIKGVVETSVMLVERDDKKQARFIEKRVGRTSTI